MKALSFTGKGFEYFKIWIVNILLTIVTLGIYYPWAKVRNNRYLYANSTLENNNFEYHATGKQLFIGYLIGITLFVLYNIANEIVPMASPILFILLLIAIPWLIYRSMKFNMNVTSFSNVRFSFDGKLKDSYITFLVYPLLFLLLIGSLFFIMTYANNSLMTLIGFVLSFTIYVYAFSFFTVKKNTYILNSSKYGQGKFSTDLKVKDFVFILLKTAGVAAIVILVCTVICGGIFFLFFNDTGIINTALSSKNNPDMIKDIIITMVPFMIFIYFIFILFGFIIMAYYITKQREYVFKNTILDEKVNFSSTLKFTKLAFIMVTNLLAIVFSFGLAIPWAKVRMTRYLLENTYIENDDISGYISQTQKQSAVGEEIGDVFDVDVAAF